MIVSYDVESGPEEGRKKLARGLWWDRMRLNWGLRSCRIREAQGQKKLGPGPLLGLTLESSLLPLGLGPLVSVSPLRNIPSLRVCMCPLFLCVPLHVCPLSVCVPSPFVSPLRVCPLSVCPLSLCVLSPYVFPLRVCPLSVYVPSPCVSLLQVCPLSNVCPPALFCVIRGFHCALHCSNSIVRIQSYGFHRADWIPTCGFYRADSIVRISLCGFYRAIFIVRSIVQSIVRSVVRSIVRILSYEFHRADSIVRAFYHWQVAMSNIL